MSSAALATYRQLLRVRGQAFRGDARALTAAQQEIRSKFEEVRREAERSIVPRACPNHYRRSQSRNERDPARVAALLQDARDAAQFLDDFVVQGARSQRVPPGFAA